MRQGKGLSPDRRRKINHSTDREMCRTIYLCIIYSDMADVDMHKKQTIFVRLRFVRIYAIKIVVRLSFKTNKRLSPN